MNYLIFGGAPNTGKSTVIYDLANYLVITMGYEIIYSSIPVPKRDFQCVLQKGNIQIIVHSYTDLRECIDELIRLYRSYPNIHAVICSARDGGDPMREYLFQSLQVTSDDFVLEIPLAKVTRRNNLVESLQWYQSTLLSHAQAVTTFAHFNF